MRLGDYLSKEPSIQYEQVEKFAGNRKPTLGKPKKIDIGQIACDFYCEKCGNNRAFTSSMNVPQKRKISSNIQMVPITNSLISIDARLMCSICGESIAVWFILDVEGDIMSQSPMVRLVKRNVKYTKYVRPKKDIYGRYSESLSKADIAFREGLGAGSIIYLRKIFESVTYEVAAQNQVNITGKNGKRLTFKDTLARVCKNVNFIPQEFSEEGYKLFQILSDVVHDEFDETEGIKKYPALRRLVRGILDRQIDRVEIDSAKRVAGLISAKQNED